jgi:cytochrome c nitrite reductase small subunit
MQGPPDDAATRPARRTCTWPGIALVAVLSLNLAAAGVLSVDHYSRAQPRFCAACHAMKLYVDSYLTSDHMDNIHWQANVGCRDCHSGYTVLDELKSAWRYVWGDYPNVLERRAFDQAMCIRCHISMPYHAARTDFLVRNPHLSHWPDMVCGDCHLAHDRQIDYCGYCHDNGGQRMTGGPIAPRADNPWARATPVPPVPQSP